MTLGQAETYFRDRCKEVEDLAKRGDVWVFIAITCMIEYLSKMEVNNPDAGSRDFICFFRKRFGDLDSRYRDFQFQGNQKDLPEQVYYILRCGLVHMFSFNPRKQEIRNRARKRSILIGHSKNNDPHLESSKDPSLDSVILSAEPFSRDMTLVVENLFKEAKKDLLLMNKIESFLKSHPPIQGGYC